MRVKHHLSKRGLDLLSSKAAGSKELFDQISQDVFDPKTNPEGFINMGVSENFAMLPELAEYVNKKHVEFVPSNFSYGEGYWGTVRLRKAMAKFIDANFSPLHPTDPEDLMFANGVTSICEMLSFTICDPGDALLFSKPVYQGFFWDFPARGQVKLVLTDFEGVDQFSPAGVKQYEKALLKAESEGTKIRALMLVNPHNPLGICYPKETIIEMMKLCQKYSIHLLCDEIYATSVYDVGDPHALPFTSALSFDHTPYIDTDLLHILYGMSKDLAAGGTRLGCIYLRHKNLAKAMRAIGMFHWAGTPSQTIAASILEDTEWNSGFLERSRQELATRNKLARKLLDEAGISYSRGANAGFFLWIDLRPWLPKTSATADGWEQELIIVGSLLKHKVFLTNGKELGAEAPGFFRVIFSQDETTLRTGMERLTTVLDGFK